MIMRISVIIRTAARRPVLLREAIESVLRQTVPPTELIIVEDGGNVLSHLLSEFDIPRETKAFHIPSLHVGRSTAGNTGMSTATGESICFLDDDDLFYPHHLEALATTLTENPKAVAAYTLAIQIPTFGRGNLAAPTLSKNTTVGHVPFSRPMLWYKNYFPIQSVLFRRHLFEKLGGFSPELEALEDWDLWLRYSAAGDFIGVKKVTSAFRASSNKHAIRKRAAIHNAAVPTVLERNRNMAQTFTFEEIQELRRMLQDELELNDASRSVFIKFLRKMFII